MLKQCEFCGKLFEASDNANGRKKRFCNTSCSAKWRNKTFGPNLISDDTKRKNAELLRNKWKTQEFRKQNYIRMTTNNPSFNKECVEKVKQTKLSRGYIPKNNFKYGNGKMSKYEQKSFSILEPLGYYYNYPIVTKLYRDAFPDIKIPNSYKPDFVNLQTKICIEIDGNNHHQKHQIELDNKKDECLTYLGFKVIRFTHTDIDGGKLEEWLSLNQNEC